MEKEQIREVAIKPLAPADWQKYKKIRLDALQNDPQAFGASYATESQRTDEEWREHIERTLEENTKNILIAAEDVYGELVGTIGAFEKEPGIWNIIAVYVKPEYRGKGVSKKLVGQILSTLEARDDITQLRLMVNTQQEAAVKLYENFGFTITSTEKNLKMGDGNTYDEYVMVKELANKHC